jgi:hypothetical protein
VPNAADIFVQDKRLHKFIIITIIVPLRHAFVICLENALGDGSLLAELRTLAPDLSPSSSSYRNPADLHVLNGFVTGPSFKFDA